MSKWKYKCNTFKEVRKLIKKNIETPTQCALIMSTLEECCDELTPNRRQQWIWYDAFRDLKSEIHDEIELMDDDYESCENMVNGWLREFYDLCDKANVWLEMEGQS